MIILTIVIIMIVMMGRRKNGEGGVKVTIYYTKKENYHLTETVSNSIYF